MFSSIIMLGLGIVMIVATKKRMVFYAPPAMAAKIYFALFGFLGILFTLLKFEQGLFYLVPIGLGGIFLGVSAFNFAKALKCKVMIQGVYKGMNHQGKKRYSPIFSYQYKKRSYTQCDGKTYRRRWLMKNYITDTKYNIWINEKHPYFFIISKRINIMDLSIFISGLVILFLPFYFQVIRGK